MWGGPCNEGGTYARALVWQFLIIIHPHLPIFHVVANLYPHDELLVLELGLLVRTFAPSHDVSGTSFFRSVRLVVSWLFIEDVKSRRETFRRRRGRLEVMQCRAEQCTQFRKHTSRSVRRCQVPVLIRNDIHASSVFRRINEMIVARLSRTTSRKTL